MSKLIMPLELMEKTPLRECWSIRNGRFFIFCNRDRGNSPNLPRGRFTLAHELGHYFIPEHRLALERGAPKHQSKCGLFDGQNVPEELEADIFAANLLMPPSRFNAAVAKCKAKTPLLTILALKEQFKTSILSTAVQFASRAPDVVALLKWNDDKLGWKRVQNEYFAKHRFCSWKPESPTDLLKGSATVDALADPPDGSQSLIRESASSAETWFKNVPAGATQNLILREEALRLGDHGVLTLLSVHPQFITPVSKPW